MADGEKPATWRQRNLLAYLVLGISGGTILVLAAIAISQDQTNTMTIFNMILPVMTSWVGTILAFYFGRENFESANQQVRESNQQVRDLVERLTPEQRAEALANAIMRPLSTTTYFQIPDGKGDADIKLSELSSKFTNVVTRLPIIDAKNKPKYLLHQSSVDKYVATQGGKLDDTLADFIAKQKTVQIEFGVDKGFVVVSEQIKLGEAKRKMEAASPCQDIFITKSGGVDEPLLGWISNVRLAKYLEV
jgi:hypothetical protein